MPTIAEIRETLLPLLEKEIPAKKVIVLMKDDYDNFKQTFKDSNISESFSKLHISSPGLSVYCDDSFGYSFSCTEKKYFELKKLQLK